VTCAAPATQSEEFGAVLEGWQIKGKGSATVENSRLVASGVSLHKTFTIDLDKYPTYEVKIDEASAGYVVKASLLRKPHRDLVRTSRTGVFRDSLPVKGRGSTKVEIHLFLSGERYVIDYVRFLPPPQRGPGDVPTGAATLAPPGRAGDEHRGQAWYLTNRQMVLAVWKGNGGVAAGWRTEPRALQAFGYCSDMYRIETRTSKTQAFEHDDKVATAKVSDDRARLELVCRNAALPGVAIRKSYWLRPEPNVIAKHVEFRTDRDWQGLIHWVHDVALAPGFREGGYYNNRYYHPRKYAFVYAKDVRVPLRQPEGQQVYFVSPKTGFTAASYRIRVNGHVVGPWCYFTPKGTSGAEWETDQYFTPRGWQFKAHLDRLWPKSDPSAEVHYTVLPGHFGHYHRQFMALPELADANNMVAPDWVREVKGMGPPSVPQRTSAQAADGFNRMLDEGVAIRSHPVGVREGSKHGWNAAPLSKEEGRRLASVVRHIRANAPRMKLGIYSWLHSVTAQYPALAEHPEWFIHGRDGTLLADNVGLHGRFLVPEHIDYVRRVIRDVQTTFDMDYLYVDGGGFGRTDVDWPTLRVVQPYAYMRMYDGTRVDGRPSFFNAINGLRGFYNAMGFFEGFIKVEDWRALAVKLYEVKLYQQPGTWSMPLYLRQNNRQEYVNYCVLLGLKPQAGIARDQLPLINMCYELDEMVLRDVGLTPCWWQKRTELEAYALGWRKGDQAEGFLITLLSHAKEAKEYEIGFDHRQAGLVPGRPTYVYHLRTLPAQDLWTNKLTEPEDRFMYEQQGWCPIMLPAIDAIEEYPTAKEAASSQRRIRANTVELVGVTQIPAVIWSVNGHRKYFPQSHTRWGSVRGSRDKGTIRLRTDCVKACEVAAFAPSEWASLDVRVDGQPAATRRVLPGLVVLAVPAGQHVIVLKETRAGQARQVVSVAIPGRVERGQTMAIRVTLDEPLAEPIRGTASLSLGVNPVYASPALTFVAGTEALTFGSRIPQTLAPGSYRARIVTDGLTLDRVPSGPVQIAIDPIMIPEGWDARENAVEEVREVSRVFAYGPDRVGYKVLRVFEQTCGKSAVNAAEVDTGSYWNQAMWATVEAGMGDDRVAGYAHAGVEIENLRVFRANIAFRRPPQVNGREAFATDPRAHVSFSVDFHTPQGYVKRVYFYANKKNETFGDRTKPWWGTAVERPEVETSVQHVFFRQAVHYHRGRWDLADYAPEGWDGRTILGSNVSMAEPGTRLFLRILPDAKFREDAPEFTPDIVGKERERDNYKYRQLRPIERGEGASAKLDEGKMVFSAAARGATAYALAGVEEWNFLIPRLAVEASGNTFLAVDYLGAKGIAKRVFLLLSGNAPNEMRKQLRRIAELDPWDGTPDLVDLRADIAAASTRYDLGLGKYAPPDWLEKSKRTLFRVGALGPNGKVKVRIIENDDFWRF